MNLTDFGIDGVEPPLIKRIDVQLSPTTGKVAGFIGREIRRDEQQLVYTTLRSGYHFYYEGNGWAVSDEILDFCENHEVSRILVHEGTSEDDDVYEFPAPAYYAGESVPEDDLENPKDPQTYVDKDAELLHKWTDHADALFTSTFERACQRIREKRGWPDDD